MRFQRRQLLRILSFVFGSSFILRRNQLGIAAQTAIQPRTSPPPARAADRHEFAGGKLDAWWKAVVIGLVAPFPVYMIADILQRYLK